MIDPCNDPTLRLARRYANKIDGDAQRNQRVNQILPRIHKTYEPVRRLPAASEGGGYCNQQDPRAADVGGGEGMETDARPAERLDGGRRDAR